VYEQTDKAQQEIGELHKLCSKALHDNLGINFAKNSKHNRIFKHIVEMEIITLSRLGPLK